MPRDEDKDRNKGKQQVNILITLSDGKTTTITAKERRGLADAVRDVARDGITLTANGKETYYFPSALVKAEEVPVVVPTPTPTPTPAK